MDAILPSYTVFAGTAGRCGLYVHTLGLVRGLAEAGHAVTLISFQKDFFSEPLKGTGINVVHCPLPDLPSAWQTYRVWSKAVKPFAGTRAVLCRGVGGASSLSILLALWRRFERVYTIEHGMADLGQIAWGNSAPARTIARQVKNRLACAVVHRAIAVSEATRESVVRVYNFDPLKIVSCHNWVDTDKFRPDTEQRQKIRDRLCVEHDCFVVGYVGRVVKEKRVDLLINGFADFKRRNNVSSRLVIVGVGPLMESLQNLVTELGISDSVNFVGWVDNPAPWHCAFDVEVLAGYAESFGLGAIEAMACGTILLANNKGGTREFVDHLKNGFIAPIERPEDLSEWLSVIVQKQKTELDEIKTNARDMVAINYSYNKKIKTWISCLD